MSSEVLASYEAACMARAECHARIARGRRRSRIWLVVALLLTLALVLL